MNRPQLTSDDYLKANNHCSIARMQVAMHDGTNLFYFASDHLSSASLMMNTSGTAVSGQRYLPFGEVRLIDDDPTGITETDFGYTCQRSYDFGLSDYHARFYSVTLGRFTQPDTIVPNLTNTQSWNRFSYVRNSPVMFNDPSGHRENGACGADDSECGGFGNDTMEQIYFDLIADAEEGVKEPYLSSAKELYTSVYGVPRRLEISNYYFVSGGLFWDNLSKLNNDPWYILESPNSFGLGYSAKIGDYRITGNLTAGSGNGLAFTGRLQRETWGYERAKGGWGVSLSSQIGGQTKGMFSSASGTNYTWATASGVVSDGTTITQTTRSGSYIETRDIAGIVGVVAAAEFVVAAAYDLAATAVTTFVAERIFIP